MGLLALFVMAGCGGPRHNAVITESGKPSGDYQPVTVDVTTEAYLFDTFIHYNGKRTSVRLELFATDSILAAGGRSYLGKGALKGWIRDDSLHIYFPQSDEYVYEPLTDLLQSVSCTDETPTLRLLDMFYHTPDSMLLDEQIALTADWSDENRPTFELGMQACPWSMRLEYDRRDPGLRLREFHFDNGDNLRIEAKRREYREQATVSSVKFQLDIPQTAIQIIP